MQVTRSNYENVYNQMNHVEVIYNECKEARAIGPQG